MFLIKSIYNKVNRMFSNKVFIVLLLCFVSLPISIYSQSNMITIDKDKLQTIIQTEISKAVDSATAIVIKDYELKIININKTNNIAIAEKQAQIDKLNIDIKAANANFNNETIKYDNEHNNFINYKHNTLGNYVIDGVIGAFVGITLEHLTLNNKF
jgi:hypothetical protein